jgi:hypothetical protein
MQHGGMFGDFFGGISYPPTKTKKVSQRHASLGGYDPE